MATFREELLAPLVSGKDVLDCGGMDHQSASSKQQDGTWLHEVVAGAARSCLGVDILAANVEAINAIGRWHFVVANAEEMTFSEQFDVVVGGEFIEHVYNAGRFLDSAWRALRPGGKLILTTPNAYRISGVAMALVKGQELCHPEHTCYYSAQTLRYLVAHHGFEVDEVKLLDRPAGSVAVRWFRNAVLKIRPNLGEVIFLVAHKTVRQSKYEDKW